MSKKFVLPMLAALPALLASCSREVPIDRYQRLSFNSYDECLQHYRPQIAQGLQNPCYRGTPTSSGFTYIHGPYFYNTGATTRYVGYTSTGTPSGTGLTYNRKSGRYGSFKAGGTSRGGFASSGRGSGSFGG